jgi:hypothetical protein
MHAVTVCLTNWKRPVLFDTALASVQKQSVPHSIFIWNNGEARLFPRVEWEVQSSINRSCWPRWFMATHAQSEFVCIMDDDVQLGDENILADGIELLKHLPDKSILGIEGVNLIEHVSYFQSDHIRCRDEGRDDLIRCDIVKGKFMLMRTSSLDACLRLNEMKNTSEDDIAISSMLAGRQRQQHFCSKHLGERIVLVDAPHALWRRPDHFDRRTRACEMYFSHKAAP